MDGPTFKQKPIDVVSLLSALPPRSFDKFGVKFSMEDVKTLVEDQLISHNSFVGIIITPKEGYEKGMDNSMVCL